MLKVNKNITLSGISEVNGVQVAYLNATISTDGTSNANVNKSIVNQELYSKNRAEVRADMDAFEEEVYKVEDEVLGGAQ
ncbi:hypothetical protein [Clostridium sp. YIM B02551]|uniref:hypothetical protein n=1 Tax=Clostridium sp. YIM B02551 TaxID=2910679 RepID=UPI001EEA58C3|nr:hypothetical protein [Clostridium sp. YIM B02551]